MQSYRWIEHKHLRVLYIELASKSKDELVSKIYEVAPVIAKEPPGSLCCVANAKDGRINPEILNLLKDFTNQNKPYMKMTVLIGLDALKKTIYDTYLVATRRKNLVTRDTLEQALEYLESLT